MVSLFPSLLTWSELSPFLIRLTLGAILAYWSYKHLKSSVTQTRSIAVVEGITGILLIIGLWVQLASLVAIIDLVIRLIGKIRSKAFLSDGINYYLILLVLAISLLITGPGFFSIDLPL